MLIILHGEGIVAKGSEIFGLNILEDSNIIVHSSSSSENFHDKNKLWNLRSGHVGCMKVVLENLNEYCRRCDP